MGTDIDGVLPKGLLGSWWRTGPGNFELGGTSIRTIDSDGMVVRISFDGQGRAFFKNRYVRTAGFVEEQRAGRVLHRGVFGTLPTDEEHLRGTKLKVEEAIKGGEAPKNVSNTALLHLPQQQRVLSMWEAGLPYSLNPETLETLGLETLGGLLKADAAFSAHPCFEHSTQRLLNFGVRPGMSPKITVWEFDVACPQVRLVREHHIKLQDQGVIHDFCITPNWAVLVHNPVAFDFDALLTKGSSVDDLLHGDPDPAKTTQIYLIPRDPVLLGGQPGVRTSEVYAQYSFPNGFCYHHATAWEDVDGSVVLNSAVYRQKPDLDMRSVASRVAVNSVCGKGKLLQYRMPLPTRAGRQDGLREAVVLSGSPDSCEMPVVRAPCQNQPQRFIYSVDMSCDAQQRPWSALMKSDVISGVLTCWQAPPRCFISEPCFVPAGAGEDEGLILVLQFDAGQNQSALLLLDARHVAAGPLCVLRLRHPVPFSTHTMWTPQPFGIPGSVSKL